MIFLSHASADKPLVRFIGEELRACGHDSWLDEQDLRVGQRLDATLTAAVESAGAMLLFVSPASLQSQWVRRELEVARTHRASSPTFIPCLLGDVRLEELPPDLADTLCADLRDPARHAVEMGRVLTALSTLAGSHDSALPPLDAHRSAELRRRATHPDIRRRVLGWLVATAADLPDPTERHWAYLTVGHLGDRSHMKVLDDAVSREDGFAHRGATRGRQRLDEECRSDLTAQRRKS